MNRLDEAALAKEVSYTASRSGGPGGQNVNKVSTKATLLFDVPASAQLTERQKARIAEMLASRINSRGILRVVCQTQRSYERNRELAWERFLSLLEDALRPRKARRETRPTAGSRERRIGEKKAQSTVKQERAAGKKAGRQEEG